MAGASRAKSITIWLKHAFPFWFQTHFGKGLFGTVKHGENAQRSAFILLAGLGDPNAADGPGLLGFPVFRVNLISQGQSLFWGERFNSIDPCRFLALVILGYPSYG
jgi:hypothetical protein